MTEPSRSVTEEQIHLVEACWQQLSSNRQELSEKFYTHLFQLDPSLKKMFPNDTRGLGAKLMSTLNIAINGIAMNNLIDDELAELGIMHIELGVKSEHYDTAWESLVLSLSDLLGLQLSDELRQAWHAVYYTIADKMRMPPRK